MTLAERIEAFFGCRGGTTDAPMPNWWGSLYKVLHKNHAPSGYMPYFLKEKHSESTYQTATENLIGEIGITAWEYHCAVEEVLESAAIRARG